MIALPFLAGAIERHLEEFPDPTSGLSRTERQVLAAIARVKDREEAALWAARLREAALKDEAGKALDGAIATIRSFL